MSPGRFHARPVGRRLAVALPIMAAFFLVACDLPRDTEGTLERARGETLVVGATEAPPFLVRVGDDGSGPEADLVGAFGRSIDAEIEWRWGSLDDQMVALGRHELGLVAAGLTTASPWAREVAFSRPWLQESGNKHVLAVAPGESRTLTELERFIESRRR